MLKTKRMNIIIKDVNFNADANLLEFTRKKAEKIFNLYDGIQGVEVNLKLESNKELENKTAEIRVIVPGNDLYASKTDKTFEGATDSSIMALRKQVERLKAK
ncbi:MAG: ribosome-associated translation inhibitor RaiA [Candidatus Kuenenia stuttgartiensis]|nr:ribosome-associated translation inhibitor RaiA [Candidatus Kuenenia stuttgartiensis]